MAEELKMWLVVRKDLPWTQGKLAAQAGHGFCTSLMQALEQDQNRLAMSNTGNEFQVVKEYYQQNQPKITVVAKNLAALERAYKECQDVGLPCSFIVDEGRTVFAEPTATVVGIGPCYKAELPKFVQNLQLMKDENA